jgi:FKBP-type peptidyl-prolyl cis-trans isomerase FkpA
MRRFNRWWAPLLSLALLAGVSRAGLGATEPGPDDKDAPKDFIKTKSGLEYRVLRKSNGKKPSVDNKVTVDYKGWLDDGKEFDSSYKRGKPLPFKMKEVVPGWTEGMQYVGEGGKIELRIPSDLGYGARGFPGAIPPNSTLHFIVELIKVE